MAFRPNISGRLFLANRAIGIAINTLLLGAFLGALNIGSALGADGPFMAALRTILTILGIAALYGVWRAVQSVWGAIGIGLLAGIAYFGVALHWLGSSANPDPETFIIRELVLTLGAMCLFYPWWAVWFGCAKLLTRKATDNIVPLTAFVSVFGITNVLLGDLSFGMPMAPLSLVALDTSLVRLFPIVGQFGVDAIIVFLGAALFGRYRSAAILGVGLIILLVFGPPSTNEDSVTGDDLIYLAQPSLPHASMMPYNQVTDIIHGEVIEHVKAGVAAGARLIALPENAVLVDLTAETELVNSIAQILPSDSAVIVGFGRVEVTGKLGTDFVAVPFNSAMLIEHSGATQIFDKAHLVPFGETMPQIFFDLGFETVVGPSGGYGSAESISLVDAYQSDRQLTFALLICYEAMLSGAVSRETDGADWLLNISSEALFRGTVGPRVLLDHVRIRSIETGLPMLRATAHAFSGVITPSGELVNILQEEASGGVTVRIPEALPTFFRATGYTPYFIIITVMFFASLTGALYDFGRQRTKQNNAPEVAQ